MEGAFPRHGGPDGGAVASGIMCKISVKTKSQWQACWLLALIKWYNNSQKMLYHRSISIDRRDADGRELHYKTGA